MERKLKLIAYMNITKICKSNSKIKREPPSCQYSSTAVSCLDWYVIGLWEIRSAGVKTSYLPVDFDAAI